MSRIGKKPVPMPAGAKFTVKDRVITLEGPKGKLTMTHRPEVRVAWDEAEKGAVVSIDQADAESREVRALWGTTRALIRNMAEGVTKGYEKTMEVVGVGWTAAIQGKKLKLVIGFANPIMMDIPDGLAVSVDKSFVKVAGPDRQMVGQFAADMRSRRKPEPYNGKGIKYTTEVIKRKAGKSFGS